MFTCKYLRLWTAVLLVNFSGLFQFGYLTSLYNQPAFIVQHFINATTGHKLQRVELDRIWSASMSMLNAGMILGTVVGYFVCQRLGRRSCILYSAALGSIGAIVQSLTRPTHVYQLLGAGRFISGLSAGMSCVVVPLYGTEVAPARFRGAVGCLCSTAFATGNLVANCIALQAGLGNERYWHYMPLLILVFTLTVLGTFSWYFPETPIYLMHATKKDQQNRVGRSLNFYHGRMSPFEFDRVTNALRDECEEGERMSFGQMLRAKHYRRAIFITIAMAAANAFHGTAAIYTYLAYIVRWTGVTDTKTIAMVSLAFPTVDVLFSLPSFVLVEKIGRRPLIIAGNCILTVCLFVISITLIIRQATDSHSTTYFYVFLAALLIDIGSISIGVAKANWFLNTELFPTQSKPLFTMVNSATQNILNMIMSVSFLPLQNAIGAYSFLILFAFPMLVMTIFLTFTVPETRRLTVTEILELLKDKPKISASSSQKGDSKAAMDSGGEEQSEDDDEGGGFLKPKYGSFRRVR